MPICWCPSGLQKSTSFIYFIMSCTTNTVFVYVYCILVTFSCGVCRWCETSLNEVVNAETWNKHRNTHKLRYADNGGSETTDGDLCPAVRSVISPLRVGIYYKTNNRKLCWLCCENSNNPHPCVVFLPFMCWLNFTASSSLVSPWSALAQSGLTLSSDTGYCFSHIVTEGLFVCLVLI